MKSLLNILNRNQKIGFLFLTSFMIFNSILEIITLNFIYIILNFFSDPSFDLDNYLFDFLKIFNISTNYANLLIIFFLVYFLKTLVFIIFKWNETKYLAKTRAELSVLFYKGYKSLPRIFHLRTNISETVKNITLETEYVVAALYALSNIAMELIILLSISIFLLTVNYKVAVTSFIFLSIFSLMIYLLNSKVVSNMGKKRPKIVQLRLKTIIEGLSLNKIFSFQSFSEKISKDFFNYNLSLAKIFQSISFRNSLPRPIFEIFILLLLVIFIYIF